MRVYHSTTWATVFNLFHIKKQASLFSAPLLSKPGAVREQIAEKWNQQADMEPAVRVELTTPCLQNRCSATELSRHGTRRGFRTPNPLIKSQLLYR